MLARPLPFALGTDRHRIGTRKAPPAQWLQLSGADVPGQLQEKSRVFDEHRPVVLAALPGSEPACQELLDVVLDQVAAAAPGLQTALRTDVHPLEAVGRLVPEDFCLHLPSEPGPLLLVAGCVCFPNRWQLPDKIGRSVVDVHDPVPGYRRQIGAPVDRLMERLRGDDLLVRSNWGLHDGDALFDPAGRPPASASGDLSTRFWLRMERQTLRRLPRSGAVVFTIRTQHAPLAIFRDDPEAASLLATAMEQLPRPMVDYKLGGPRVQDAAVRWLRGRARGISATAPDG